MADERIEVTKEQLLAMTPDEVRAAYSRKPSYAL